jgi:hypothetical protein
MARPVRKPPPTASQPLDYMLSIVRDPDADPKRRDKMAIAAAQYCHPRVAAVGKGKKARAAEAAKTAGENSGWGDLLKFEH